MRGRKSLPYIARSVDGTRTKELRNRSLQSLISLWRQFHQYHAICNWGLTLTNMSEPGIPMQHNEPYEQAFKVPGHAYIFNNKNFKNGNSTRKGSEKDVAALKETFKSMNFTEQTFTDITCQQFSQALDKIEATDFSESACLFMVVMSHGDDGIICMTDGNYQVDHIMRRFYGDKCATLVGKPKIFIFQACRGSSNDGSVAVADRALSDGEDDGHIAEDGTDLKTIPGSADILICNATNKGFFSYRYEETGSIYIQTLTKMINAYIEGHMEIHNDFLGLLCIVARHVGDLTVKLRRGTAKQIPVFTSSLRKLYFPLINIV